MTDSELRQALRSLGIDESAQGVIGVLPLVQVAWSDGVVHPRERDLILAFARQEGFATAEGIRVLDTWLTHAPTPAYMEKGTVVLLELAARSGRTFSDMLQLCEAVAAAAGGLFRRVEPAERETLDLIARALSVRPDAAWQALVARQAARFSDVESEWLEEERTGVGMRVDHPVPAAAGEPGLAWVEGTTERVVPLNGRVRIGRGRDNEVQLAHDGLSSRQHAEVFREGDGVYVKDLGSLNGTLVEGERVVERRLFGGEAIVVGATTLRWRA
jgi:tellurite resistance protein